ncbi:hypothetical protein Pmani_009731 [Petrolisthes manimaculis]|uniref:Uncharacterized protein n=1 Tax=Petrolisthes manimaculis TaxID=1843537 RepID=A0AAE1Q2W9_9EUCA|nr:hypothetical protein Pmani_009731 [Petrolisthes manimaculis]
MTEGTKVENDYSEDIDEIPLTTTTTTTTNNNNNGNNNNNNNNYSNTPHTNGQVVTMSSNGDAVTEELCTVTRRTVDHKAEPWAAQSPDGVSNWTFYDLY